jgi:hypothetical protein
VQHGIIPTTQDGFHGLEDWISHSLDDRCRNMRSSRI